MSPARQRLANRFDLSLPDNQPKLDAAEQLAALADRAGLSLIELAIAFVLRDPRGHRGHHRPAHHGAPGVPAARG